jgi:hypothetical protein
MHVKPSAIKQPRDVWATDDCPHTATAPGHDGVETCGYCGKRWEATVIASLGELREVKPDPRYGNDEGCRGPHAFRAVVTREGTWSECKWCGLKKEWGKS